MRTESYLKPYLYYADLYDRHTVDICRGTVARFGLAKVPSIKGKKVSKENIANINKVALDLYLYYQTGERYLNKDKVIKEWMDNDTKKDNLYENAQAPENIHCLTCRKLVKPTFKEMWGAYEKEDRILFMYECPNGCLPRRSFFSDGEEWRTEPHICPHCSSTLKSKAKNSEEKLVTTYTCSKCNYTKSEELLWTSKEKEEEQIDELFAEDRDRFCISDEKGKEFQDHKYQMGQLDVFMKEWNEEKKAREEKLKENPKGFHLDGVGYTCAICGHGTQEQDNWYDKYGIKCLTCQWSIDKKEVPATCAKGRDTWYSNYDMEDCFNLKTPTLRSWVRKGILKARTVTYNGKGFHFQLYLIKDNKELLPPKVLVKSHSISGEENGRTWHRMEPWYKCVKNPNDHLKGYKIMDYIKIVNLEEEKAKNETGS